MVEIKYVWHDCFIVVTDTCSMVFDYWCEAPREDSADGPDCRADMPGAIAVLDRSRPLYVFVSHSHKDHYNPAIFAWAQTFDKIRYIVSNDVYRRMRHVISATSVYNGPKVEASKVTAMRAGDVFDDGCVRVRAFPSTDIGNSYAVSAAGRDFFHAGDLNAWIWKDESAEEEIRKAVGDFEACLHSMHDSGIRRFDYAFFPVDSRIGTDYFTGASMFVREFDVARFFPMHFALGDAHERSVRLRDALRFSLYLNPERGEYIPLAYPGFTFVDCS